MKEAASHLDSASKALLGYIDILKTGKAHWMIEHEDDQQVEEKDDDKDQEAEVSDDDDEDQETEVKDDDEDKEEQSDEQIQ